MNITATIFGQLLTFGVLVWFVMRYLWEPMTQMMQDRTKRIEEGLSAGERGKHELELSQQKAADNLRKAKQDAAEIIASANKQASEIVEEAKNDARAEGQRQLHAAQAEIEQEKSRAKEQLREEVASLALACAEKVLAREVSADAHGEFIDQMIKEL